MSQEPRTQAEPTAEYLLQQATEHPDYVERRKYAYQLYQRGLREGVAIANAATDASDARILASFAEMVRS